MISFLPFLMGLKQCVDNLGSKLTDYIKCRSNCCNNINVYTPKNCAIMGSISNRWMRATTPDIKKGSNSDDAFYTPKN